MEREYIAYISYRHTPTDMAAAIAIQHQIERYRIPKKLQKDGKSRLGMVFRDTDELNISPDLSKSLCEALDRSEYLLVLCSPQYKESEWCRQEIVYFLKHHNMDHVLPILVDGTPAEAFPEEIMLKSIKDGKEVVSEPLAANVAGKTVKELKQNIKKEYLRIVAKMLGCHYDELVQRQRRYERQRRVAVIGTAFAVLLAFVITLLIKNAQVNSRYQEARRNQARYLSTVALEQYEKGDAKSALSSVLTILPENGDVGPVAPEQMYALATVLNAYNNSYVPKNFISLPEDDRKVFSSDSKYLFSYSGDLLTVYELSSGEVCRTLVLSEFLKDNPKLSEKLSASAVLKGIIPAEGGKFFMLLGGSVIELDLNATSHCRYVAEAYGDIVRYQSGKLAVCSGKGAVSVYDCATGNLLYEKDFNANSAPVAYSVCALDWNENAELLAVGFDYSNDNIKTDAYRSDSALNRQEEEYFRQNSPMGLVLIDPASGETAKLSDQRTMELSFAGNAVGAVHREYLSYDVTCRNSIVSIPARWSASVYDAASKQCIYESDRLLGETYNFFGFTQEKLSIDSSPKTVYNLWLGKTGIVLNAEDQSILYMESFRADIVDMVAHNDSSEMIILSNGSIQLMMISGNTYLRTSVMKLDVAAEQAAKAGDDYYLIAKTGLIQCSHSVWENVCTVECSEPELGNYTAKVFDYFDSKNGRLRLVGYDLADDSYRRDGDYSALELYPCLSDEVMFSYIADDPKSCIRACNVSADGKQIYILEQQPDSVAVISCFSLSDGTQEFRRELSSEPDSADALTDLQACGFSADRKLLWVAGKTTVHLYDLEEKDICRTLYQASGTVENPAITENGKHVVWMEADAEAGGKKLSLLNTQTGEYSEAGLPEHFGAGWSNVILAADGGTVLIYDGKVEALVYDTEKEEFCDPFPVSSNSKLAILGNGTEFLVACEEELSLYDLETGELKSRLVIPYAPDRIITDSGSDAFAVYIGASYSSENDNGWFVGGQYLISVDSERNMYLSAFIGAGSSKYISPSGGEIVSGLGSGSFEFSQTQSFEQLVAAAT